MSLWIYFNIKLQTLPEAIGVKDSASQETEEVKKDIPEG